MAGGEATVGLTRRRREVLRGLIALRRELGGPVHYTLLARKLGVSKWTAYEVLRALEKEGYVRAYYEAKGGKAGRPGIVFEPTEKALEEVEPKPLPSRVRTEWAKVKRRILKWLAERPRNYLDLLKEAKKQREVLPFCGCVLGALVAGASAKGGPVLDEVANLIRQGRGEWVLLIVAGMLLSATARRRLKGLYRHLVKFQEEVERVGAEGRRALLDFLVEALKAVRGEREVSTI
ncbi:MAG TPA: hypothetical protein EYP65_05015 [Armatimonadetes bacterium]|nr:hypothetical protein [Armatimonadota bacterium]